MIPEMKTIKLKTTTLACWMTRDNLDLAGVELWRLRPHLDVSGRTWIEAAGTVITFFTADDWEAYCGKLPPKKTCQKVRIQILP